LLDYLREGGLLRETAPRRAADRGEISLRPNVIGVIVGGESLNVVPGRYKYRTGTSRFRVRLFEAPRNDTLDLSPQFASAALVAGGAFGVATTWGKGVAMTLVPVAGVSPAIISA